MTISSLLVLSVLSWTNARADYAWVFPQDHWAHHGYKTEWWYFTGELTAEGATAPRFAYQFTLFNVGLSESPPLQSEWSTQALLMGHAAITDLTTGQHRFSEVVQRLEPTLAGFGVYPDPRIAWCRAPAGTTGRWELTLKSSGFAFSMADAAQGYTMQLVTTPTKSQIFEGPNGYSKKGAGAASLYYSQTRLATEGTMTVDGVRYSVHGESWMDKELSSTMRGSSQIGWDWFSLQLSDGREIMLYMLRGDGGDVDFASGTLVTAEAVYLGREDFSVTSDRKWTSPHTHATYPARWHVLIPKEHIDLTIEPVVADQENVSTIVPDLFYWEGDVRISGSAHGHGFVELTGYKP